MRWRILAVLFTARLVMAFQYQSVAALSPLVEARFAVGLAEIGWLIGLYFAPGIAVALPGGALARRIGERNIVLIGLALMCIGGLAAVFSSDWSLVVAGRVLAGIGGVVLNVVLTKMLTDWFAGKEIATAMALFINSWPVGIALALVVLPAIGVGAGYAAATASIVVLAAIALALFGLVYRAPAGADTTAASSTWPGTKALALVFLAGSVWGLLNVAIAAVFAFGPSVLMERGAELQPATAQISTVMWALAVVTPFGGILTDRTGRRDLVITAGFVLCVVGLGLAWARPEAWLAYVLIGAATGLSAGPIMTMPAAALTPPERVLGMGIFFTLYYVYMVLGPGMIGYLADTTGSALIAYPAGIMVILCAFLCLAGFRMQMRSAPQSSL